MQRSNTYPTPEEAHESLRKRPRNGNVRFPFFCQAHPTAGDERDFFEMMHRQLAASAAAIDQAGWEALCLTHALLARQAKGIAVVIRQNRIAAFVPFSHVVYSNTWGMAVQRPADAPSMLDLLREAADAAYPFESGRVEVQPSLWRGNGHLVRYEHPASHSDSGVPAVHWFLTHLCGARTIPDCEFFVNRRDFPQMCKDHAEPHADLVGSAWGTIPIRPSPGKGRYAPLLAMVAHAAYSDIAIPTWDDMSRGCFEAEASYLPKCRVDCRDPFVPWDEKLKAQAVFRGASTGRGVTVETNPRLRAAYLCATNAAFADACDAGITHFSRRLRKLQDSEVLARPPSAESLGLAVAPYLDAGQQAAGYKYILHLPGHSAAYRLATELATGSVLLLVAAPYHLWFQKSLVHGQHYLEVRSDLSDLVETVQWCRANDGLCRQIAANARAFYEAKLRLPSMLDHTQAILAQLAASAAVSAPQKAYGTPVGTAEYYALLRRLLSATSPGFGGGKHETFDAARRGHRTLADLARSPAVTYATIVRHATSVLVTMARARGALGFEHGNMGPERVGVLGTDGAVVIHDIEGSRLFGGPLAAEGHPPYPLLPLNDIYRGDLVACPRAHPSCDTLAFIVRLCAVAFTRPDVVHATGPDAISVLVDFAWPIVERTTPIPLLSPGAERAGYLRLLCHRLCPWVSTWSRYAVRNCNPRCLVYSMFPPVVLLPVQGAQ